MCFEGSYGKLLRKERRPTEWTCAILMPAGLIVKPQVNITNTVEVQRFNAFTVLIQLIWWASWLKGKCTFFYFYFYSTYDVLVSYHRMMYMSTLSGKWELLDLTVVIYCTETLITLCVHGAFTLRYPIRNSVCLKKTCTMARLCVVVSYICHVLKFKSKWQEVQYVNLNYKLCAPRQRAFIISSFSK